MSDHPTRAETPAVTVASDLLKTQDGRVINGKWQLQSQVGSGGMATVFAATGPVDGTVAIKLMHAAQARDPLLRKRFIREAELMERVEHAGSVRIFEYGSTPENELYIVMELLDGVPVSDLWKRHEGRLPLELAVEIGQQTLGFLSACHALGIFHRDLKPSNLFLTGEGVLKVLDFGVAHVETAGLDLTTPGQALGTPAFMSPEQAAGRLDLLDQRSDIFSLGATLFTLLSGQRLHEAASSQQAFVLAATSQATSLARVAPDVPLEVIRIVDKACSWDPKDRYQSVDEMREALTQYLSALDKGDGTAAKGLSRDDESRVQALSAAALEEEDLTGDTEEMVRRLRSIFQFIDRALGVIRRYGWDHQEADNRLKLLDDAFQEALDVSPDGLQWSILPHSFTYRTKSIWEPDGVGGDVPYYLFASGFRMIRVIPGFNRRQLTRFMKWLVTDPLVDLPPEDDLATVFWDLDLPSVEYRLVTSISMHAAMGEHLKHFEELEELVGHHLDRSKEIARMVLEMGREAVLEAHAMEVGRERAGMRGVRTVDQRALERLRRVMKTQATSWSARLGRVLASAFVEAGRTDELQLITEPIAELGTRYIRTGRFSPLSDLYQAGLASLASEAHKREFAAHVFTTANLRMLMDALISGQLEAQAGDGLLEGLGQLMDVLPEGNFDVVLSALTSLDDRDLQVALIRYIERFIDGNEARLGRTIQTAAPSLALELVRIIRDRAASVALPVLRFGAKNPSVRVRVNALEARASFPNEDVTDELRALLEERDAKARVQALRVIGEYGISQAAVVLADRAEEKAFHQVPESERRLVLELLWELDKDEGEDLCLLLAHRAVVPDKDRSDTRSIAIGMLGDRASSHEAIHAVKAATRWGWWNSRQLRKQAAHALASIERRIAMEAQ